MNVLLLAMPDSFEHMPSISVRMPSGALTSLAGNVDPHHKVAVADLLLVRQSVREAVCRLVEAHAPDVVGLSVMTFQRRTAMAIIELIRRLRPGVLIVVGGYDPSLAREVYAESNDPRIDFIVRGEGEITFRELLRAIESKRGFDHIAGLSFRDGGSFHHNLDRGVSDLDGGQIDPPKRSARVLSGYTMLGRQIDVVETSRGCTFDCSFCSIIEMRGRNFHRFEFDRVLDDIRDARANGATSIFLVDDNITLNVRRFEALCQAIIDAGLHSMEYTVQAMTSAMADHGETLCPLMRKAGFRYVFLGIENVVKRDLVFLNADTKNMRRVRGKRTGNASLDAVRHIRSNGMYVVGGLIVGNPGDTRESIEENLAFARRWVDWPYIQHPTPYPGTPMKADLERKGLITSHAVEEYDGTTAVVACEHLSGPEIEFLRWKTERWIKARHGLRTLRDNPVFTLRYGVELAAHIFRGETLRSLVGLEPKRRAFERYRAIRARERQYL
jgi:radical SAM superfamily enzyme YgiQ (UPF0313 family)